MNYYSKEEKVKHIVKLTKLLIKLSTTTGGGGGGIPAAVGRPCFLLK